MCVRARACACMLSRFSRVRLFATLWAVASQAPLSMGFSRQEYWSGLPYPPPGNFPYSGTEPVSLMCPALQAGSLSSEPSGKPLELPNNPAIPLMGVHPEEIRTKRDACTPMFIAALLTIARTRKQPRCPSENEWIRK